MSNAVIRKVTLGASYAPLVSESLICSADVLVSSDANQAFLLSDDGVNNVPLDPGQRFRLEGVDLSTIQARAVMGKLSVIGFTRTV